MNNKTAVRPYYRKECGKAYLNAGHDRQLIRAVNRRLNLCECDAAYEFASGVQQYLERNE